MVHRFCTRVGLAVGECLRVDVPCRVLFIFVHVHRYARVSREALRNHIESKLSTFYDEQVRAVGSCGQHDNAATAVR